MFSIALTTIPSRFATLPRVLASLAAQTARPETIYLTVPNRWARFDPAPLPALPFGVTLIQTPTDLGPAGKLLGPAEQAEGDLLICDDDWIYPPDWAESFVAARRKDPNAVFAGSTWPSERIGYAGGTILQGFAGALVPAKVARLIPAPPPEAWHADDIWISAQLDRLGTQIQTLPRARQGLAPLADPGALQSDPKRDQYNRAAAQAAQAWQKL